MNGFSEGGEMGMLETVKWSSKSLGKGRRVFWEVAFCGDEVVAGLCCWLWLRPLVLGLVLALILVDAARAREVGLSASRMVLSSKCRREWVVGIESALLGFLASANDGVVVVSKLYCMIWKNVLELWLPVCILIAASRLANSTPAAG